MKSFLLGSVLIAASSGEKLRFGGPGSECTWGPAYWCENIQTAHKCGDSTKQFCINNHWSAPTKVSNVCETCKTAVGLAHMYLTDNKTREEVKGLLDYACDVHRKEEEKTKCLNLINEETDYIFDVIAEAVDPSIICSALQLCMASDESDLTKAVELAVENMEQPATMVKIQEDPILAPIPIDLQNLNQNLKSSAVQGKEMCALCEYVLEQIEEKLADHASEGKIIDLLDEACDYLPKTVSDQCKAIAEIYGPQIIKMLEANLDPKIVCNALSLCTGVKRELPQFCSAKKEIGMCRAAMPSFYFDSATGACNEFDYGGCGGNDNRFDSAYECTKTCGKEGFKLSKCDDCKLAIAYLDSYLSDHANEEEIRKQLDDLCKQVPGGFADQCQALVDTYADEILKYAANIMDPLFVCEKIRLCDVDITPIIKPVRPKLVGANKCTYGPSYWCASRENAESCGATDHCLKNGGFK